jgi:signal transduction histidine kinase
MPRNPLSSLRARLFAGFGLVILLSLLLSAAGSVLLLREEQTRAAEQRIGLLVGPLTARAQEMIFTGWPMGQIEAELTEWGHQFDVRVLLLDEQEVVVIDTDPRGDMLGIEIELPVSNRRNMLDSSGMNAFRAVRFNLRGEDLYLFSATATQFTVAGFAFRAPDVQLLVAVPAGDVTSAWSQLLPQLLIAGGSAGALAFVVGTLFAARITIPVREMTRASEAMARGDLDHRVDASGDDEIAKLARAFNQMSAQVSRSNRAMRDLMANVSHDLKTPLTSIQGFSQAMVDGISDDPEEYARMAAVVHEEAERVRAMLDDLIYLSEIESGALSLELDEVDIDALVRDTARRLSIQAGEAGVSFEFDLGGVAVRGDGRRLEQVLANLVENAVRFAPEDSAVTLSTTARGERVEMRVHNGGDPIPENDLPRVFDRFYQADPARSGGRHSGLGLAIVHELVLAHDGDVTVESSADSGTTFAVRIPIAGPSVDDADRFREERS